MPYELKGRNVLITASSRGLGAEVARRFAARGCNIAINYFSSPDRAQALAKELESTHSVRIVTLQADCGSSGGITELVNSACEKLGGLDIVIGNHGWTRFSNFADLDALSDDEWDRCWRTNVMSMKAMTAAVLPIINQNPEGGVVLITSSVAGRVIGGSSMAYSVTKAAQLHLVKCMSKTQGKKLRINAVLPGLLLTEWGLSYGKEAIEKLKNDAVLGKETDLGDCAEAFVDLASNASITGQFVQVDSGLHIQHM